MFSKENSIDENICQDLTAIIYVDIIMERYDKKRKEQVASEFYEADHDRLGGDFFYSSLLKFSGKEPYEDIEREREKVWALRILFRG